MPSSVFSNAVIRFGLSEDNFVKAYLQITENILPNEEIIIASIQRPELAMFTEVVMIGGSGSSIDVPRKRPRLQELKEEDLKEEGNDPENEEDDEEEDPAEDSYTRRLRNLMRNPKK